MQFVMWDVGAHPLWCYHMDPILALVYVVSAEDVVSARDGLRELAGADELRSARLLVLVNRRDADAECALSDAEVSAALRLSELPWTCHVQRACAVTGEGLLAGLGWLAGSCQHTASPAGLYEGNRTYLYYGNAAQRLRRQDREGWELVVQMNKDQRLRSELYQCNEQVLPLVSFPNPDSPEVSQWDVTICGAPGSPYEGVEYRFVFTFGDRYPTCAPSLHCLTPNGRIPVGEVPLPSLVQWEPYCSVETVVAELAELLFSPGGNADDVKRRMATDAAPVGRPPAGAVDHDLFGALLLTSVSDNSVATCPFPGKMNLGMLANLAQSAMEYGTSPPSRSGSSGSGDSPQKYFGRMRPFEMSPSDFDALWATLHGEMSGVIGSCEFTLPDCFYRLGNSAAAAQLPDGALVLLQLRAGDGDVCFKVRGSALASQRVAAGLESLGK
eukprot:TRINITY_DN28401_c0_g1_i1.p1 TRINITY_DN28401_c0_g1~~TRINITY_DN28401_c0_g1_i1.p1  ORF type:complete len:442 (+),score=106.20 TRINITY_DN28401_c0_g1_i1:340-1665(+)